MQLDENQKNKVLLYLNTNAPTIKCPVCGHAQWGLSDRIFETREFVGGGLELGGNSSIMPFIVITCTYCAHSLLFNAIQMGILTQSPAKPDESKSNGVKSPEPSNG